MLSWEQIVVVVVVVVVDDAAAVAVVVVRLEIWRLEQPLRSLSSDDGHRLWPRPRAVCRTGPCQ